MIRRLSYCLILLLLAACVPEGAVTPEWDGPVLDLELQIESAGDDETKASGYDANIYEQDGENVFHENDIKTVDFFFYPAGETSSDATYHVHREMTKLTRNSASFRIELTTNDVNYRIFPSLSGTTEAVVFALVNVSKDLLDAQDNTSMNALKQLLVTTHFEAQTAQENHRQQSFMMSGEGTLRLKQPNGRSQKEVAEPLIVEVSRYACKLTVGIKTEDSVQNPTNRTDDEGHVIYETWTPCVQEMKIYLEDGVNTVSLAGTPREAASDAEKLSYRSNPMLFFENRNTGTAATPILEQVFDMSPGGYYNTYPTYMYPQTWDDGKSGEPYLKLVLPWERQGDGGNKFKKEFYYKILIPKDRRGGEFVNTFTRNNWYHYNIDVGMLGADTDDASVMLNPVSCYIYYWQDKNVVVKQADIGNARYFSVNQEKYVLNNETELPIRFTTSHPVSYTIKSATRPYYGTKSEGNKVGGGTIRRSGDGTNTYADQLYPAGTLYLNYNAASWFSKDGNVVYMNHALVADYTNSSFDYSPYIIILTLYHTDKGENSDYSETVTITQNPAIYITAEENSDPKITPQGRTEPYDDTAENAPNPVWQNYEHNGYVFIDGDRIWRHKTSRNDDGEYGTNAKHLNPSWTNNRNATLAAKLEWLQWRTVNFTGGNRNRYTINVSSLPVDSEYCIGDPRTLVPETWNNGYEASSTAQPASKYYYWYDSNGDGTRDIEDTQYHREFNSAPDLRTGEVRQLTNYYPAEESSRTANMLAPALRVASRFGGVEFYDGITQRSARFKCATYQEDGYPAGRWRLPTQGEIVFISTLTTKGGFVKLFSDSGKYWCANGVVRPKDGILNNQTYALVRCVYDAWYWDVYDDRLPPEGSPTEAGFDRDTYVFGDFAR